jgi:SOS-response transcriptional repressor LexA
MEVLTMKEEEQSVGKIINARRTELNLTQKEVADFVGVSEATVSRWESGQIDNMRRDKIASLATVLKISPLAIMGIPIGAAALASTAAAVATAGSVLSGVSSAVAAGAAMAGSAAGMLHHINVKSKQRKIPLLGKVAAGAPIYADDHVEGYEYIDSKYNNDGFEYFALRVSGHSMEPTIKDGDIVIVRQQDTVDSGQIAIVLVAGEDATAKEVRIDKSGITLVGHNLAVYTPQFYTNAQVVDLPVTIIGLVIEVRHKLI